MVKSLPESSTLYPDSTFFPLNEVASDGLGATGNVYDPLWRQMGVGSCRAILFDLNSLQPVAGRWMRADGGLSGGLRAADLDAAFKGVQAHTMQWVYQAPSSEQPVKTEMLSPRRWVYLWHLDANTSMVAQVHYLDSHATPDEFEMTGMKVLCEHWLSGERQARRDALAGAAGLVENGRDGRALPGPKAVSWPAMACMLGALLVALWLIVGAADMVGTQLASSQRENARLAEVADQMASEPLALALSNGDYGEVQQVLMIKAKAGFFADAAVTNARGQVVALAGAPDGLRIGDVAPASTLGTARVLPLISGTSKLGNLLISPTKISTVKTLDVALALKLAGAALALLVLVATVLLWRQGRRA